MAPLARPLSAGRRPSSDRRSALSASSLAAGASLHKTRAHAEDGGLVGFMLQTLYDKLPSTQYRSLASLNSEPSFRRLVSTLRQLATSKPNEVLGTVFTHASSVNLDLPPVAEPFSPPHQVLLFLLELAQECLPTVPTTSFDDDPDPLELDGRAADQLLALAGKVLFRNPARSSEPISRPSEDSSSRPRDLSSMSSFKKGRKNEPFSRPGALSPSVSSLSVGGSSRPTKGGNPSFVSQDTSSPLLTTFDIQQALSKSASDLVRTISYFRWDAFFASFRSKLQSAAQENDLPSSSSDLTELHVLGHTFVDRTRVGQILSELTTVFLHVSRSTQIVLARATYGAIWSFLHYSPEEFTTFHLSNQGDLSSLFDMTLNATRDQGVVSPALAREFWPVMGMWVGLSGGVCTRLVEQSERGGVGNAAKKIIWFESLQTSIRLPKFASTAQKVCIDLVYLSTLLPRGDEYSLKLMVSDFAGELLEGLTSPEESNRDLELVSFGLYALIRRNPRDVLLSSLPNVKTSKITWQKVTLSRALLRLQKEMPGVFFDGDLLFEEVAALWRDFVRSLGPEPNAPAFGSEKLSTLTSIELDLLLSIVTFFTRDVRFILPPSSPSSDLELGSIINALSSVLGAPVGEEVKNATRACLKEVFGKLSSDQGQGGEDVWRVLGNAAWAPLTHAALPIFKPSLSDEADLLQSFDAVSEMFELACVYSSKHTWYLASRTALLEALALHEAACIFLALSTDPSLAARGLEGLKGRGARMESVLKGMSDEERESENGKELAQLARLWEVNVADAEALRQRIHQSTSDPRPVLVDIVVAGTLETWRSTGRDIDIMPFDSPELEDWRHATSFLGSYCGRALAKEINRSSALSEVANEFVNGLTSFLRHPDSQIRASVEVALGGLHPALSPSVVSSLHELSRELLDRDRAPVRDDSFLDLIASSAVALTSLLSHLKPSHLIQPTVPPFLSDLCFNFIDHLSSISADRSTNAHPPVTTAAMGKYIQTLAEVARMLRASLAAQATLKLAEAEQRLLASVALDTLANWTSVTLVGFAEPIVAADLQQLNLSTLSAALTAVRAAPLMDEHRAGRSRVKLVYRWVGVCLELATSGMSRVRHQILGAASQQTLQPLLIQLLSELLSTNGDIAADPLLAAASSPDPPRRVLALATFSDALERQHWPTDAPKLARPVEPEPGLLRLLNDHNGVSLSPSILYHISGSSTDNDALAELLLRQSESKGQLFQMLEILCQVEVANTNGETDIFRSATLTTKVFTLLAKRHALNYFRTVLEPFILAVCEGHPSRFDNDSRSSSSSDSTNARAIEILAQTCFDRICESAATVPPVLKEACRILGDAVEKKFKGLRRRAVSSFIILRVMSPAMISPASIHISHPNISGGGRRTLVEVSKLLVHLANDASLGKAVDADEYADFLSSSNIVSMIKFLNQLQMSSTPAVFTPLSTSESSADELFLRLYLSSNIAALDNAPKGNLLEERLSTIFSQGTQRSTMTLGRVFSSEHMSSASRWRTSNEFFKRCSNMALPSLDSIQDVSTPSKIIYAVDFSRLPSVELDMFLYAALRTVHDSLGSFSLVFDCSTLPVISSGVQKNLTTWIFAALQVIPDEIATMCRKVVLWSPNSWIIKTFRHIHALVSQSGSQGFFDKVVACSSTPALAHHLEVAEDELMLSSILRENDLVFSDESAEVVDQHGQRRPVVLSVDDTSLVLRHVKTESLHNQHGHAQTVVKDKYRLDELVGVTRLVLDSRYQGGLRFTFKREIVVDVVSKEHSGLETLLLASLRPSALEVLHHDQACVRLFFLGLVSMSAQKDAVRSEGFALLCRLSRKIVCPDLKRLEGFVLPAAVNSEIAVLVEQAARCNPPLAPLFLKELCLSIGPDCPDSRLLLEFLQPFLRNVASASGSTVGLTEKDPFKAVVEDLITMTLKVGTSGPLGGDLLRIWESVGKADPSLASTASEVLLARAMETPFADHVDMFAEIMSAVSAASTFSATLAMDRKAATVRESTDSSFSHAVSHHARALQVLGKLSYSRTRPSHVAISLPEVLVRSLRSFASGLETEVDAALAITANIFHSLGNDAHATKIDDILLQLSSLVIPLLPRLESGVSPLALAERMDHAAQLLQRLVVLVSPNEDQRNVWIRRWLGLSATVMASSDEITSVAALATLRVLMAEAVPETDFVLQIFSQLAKELEQCHRPHQVVGLTRLLESMVGALSEDSVISLFWIGLGISKVGSLYFAVGVGLVASSLAALVHKGVLVTPSKLYAFLELPRCSFLYEHLEDDWSVRFGTDGSLAFGVLALLYKGLLCPSTMPQTREALLLVLSLLLQSDHIEPLEELTLLVALSLVDDDLAGCKEVYSTLGRSFVDVEHLVIPEGKWSLACLAFTAGPRLGVQPVNDSSVLPFSVLTRAISTAPATLTTCQDLLVVHLEEALATSNSEKSLELGAELYPFAALSSGNNSLDRLLRTLSSLGVPYLHMCHEVTEPRKEVVRRLSFIASVLIKAESARLFESDL